MRYAEVGDDENGNPAFAVVARCYASDAWPLTGRFRMADFGLTRTDGPVEKAVVPDVMANPSLTDEQKAR